MNTFIFGTERYCWFLHVVYVSCHFTGFITSCWVLVEPSGFSMCPQIMWPTNRHVLVFLSGYHTFSPPRLMAPAMTSTRMLESTEIDISAHDLWEKAYDSSLCMLIVVCHLWSSLCWGIFPTPNILRFYWEKKLNFVKCIFLSDMTAWLLFSKLSIWCILFIDLHMFNSPCITGIRLILLVKIFIFACICFVHIHVHMYVCCGVHVKVREWLGAVGSFLSSHGFQGLNSGEQPQW